MDALPGGASTVRVLSHHTTRGAAIPALGKGLLPLLPQSVSALVLKHGRKKRKSTLKLTYVPLLAQNFASVRLGSTGTRLELGGLVRHRVSVISACAHIVYMKQ